eukprot:354264-Chlamydomonas_euryale.AAC.1
MGCLGGLAAATGHAMPCHDMLIPPPVWHAMGCQAMPGHVVHVGAGKKGGELGREGGSTARREGRRKARAGRG